MSTPPPATPGKVRGGLAGLTAKAGGQRNILIAAAIGTAAVAYFMSRSGGTAAAGGGTDQTFTGYDSTPYDQYNSLQSQLEDIQKQIDEGRLIPGTPVTPPPTPPAPKPSYPGTAKPAAPPTIPNLPTRPVSKVTSKTAKAAARPPSARQALDLTGIVKRARGA